MSADRIALPARPRILVIALRRLGDVLLTTPLIRSLRRAWPDATIDALVFADTAGILDGNPDLDGTVAMPPRPSAGQSLALAARLWRSYDLVVSTQTGDRPDLFRLGGRQKARSDRLPARSKTPCFTAASFNRMACIGSSRSCGWPMRSALRACRNWFVRSRAPVEGLAAGDYAVIHAAPMFRYKQWTPSGWRELAAALAARGLAVIATGGPAEPERRYLDEVWRDAPVQRLDGRLDWPQLAGLLAKARVYVGPDTSVTHLAAAAGCPTVALYGPTDPRLWGPWPVGGLDTMWAAAGTVQRRGNVFLVQHAFPCTPCQLEGCERRLDSDSQCLIALTPRQVIDAVDQALAKR